MPLSLNMNTRLIFTTAYELNKIFVKTVANEIKTRRKRE